MGYVTAVTYSAGFSWGNVSSERPVFSVCPMIPSRPIKACTNCRQQKIKCNAGETYPNPCERCKRYGRECVVDPHFRPRKGGQVELLREDVRRLQSQIREMQSVTAEPSFPGVHRDPNREAMLGGALPGDSSPSSLSSAASEPPQHPSISQRLVEEEQNDNCDVVIVPTKGPYRLEDIVMSSEDAERLHTIFINDYLVFMPIMESKCAANLYSQSPMLFWTVMMIASQSEPTSDLYVSLVDPIKRLMTEVCWLQTPRSSHIVQALILLSMWPLPNEKMLDDPSQRFITLANCLGLQLGMHRGKFIYEFSRTQKLMPNAVKWRTRAWVGIYICREFLSASMGVPVNVPIDYLIDQATTDPQIPGTMRAVLRLAIFYSKIVSIMGTNVLTPDGLMSAKSRAPTLEILSHDLAALRHSLHTVVNDILVDILSTYLKAVLCCFAFLPDTPESEQSLFIVDAYKASTRLVTLVRKYVGNRRIAEFPIFVRQASSFAAMLLFRLHLLPQFPQQYLESARSSVVTVHHMYRNEPASWALVQNDTTRFAKLLESLNHVLITHPYLLMSRQIMKRNRSHLTFSIFYELLWCVHEARRRNFNAQKNGDQSNSANQNKGREVPDAHLTPRFQPLPLLNQMSKDSYSLSTAVSPNGTTTTNLIANGHNSESQPVSEPPPVTLDLPLGQLLEGIDWMNYEGDDFLGWMPNGKVGI